MILLALFSIGLMGMVLAQVATSELAITSNIAASSMAFLPADGASEILLRDLIVMSRQLGRFPTDAELATIQSPSFNSVTLSDFRAFADGPEAAGNLSGGLYVGMAALIQPFRIVVSAQHDGPTPAEATVEIEGEFASIPVFQFGALYEEDLELFPGAEMTLAGRLHSNGDIYMGSNATLSIDRPVTGAGRVYNRFKNDGSVPPGTVRILDSQSVYQSVDGLDSDDPDWTSEALDRWDGRVRSGDLGGERLDLLVDDPSDPRILIQPGRPADTAVEQAAKLFYDADIRILNGRAYDRDGNQVSLVDSSTNESALRFTVIWDPREEQNMLTMEVDIDKLGRSAAFPPNGTIYVGGFEPVDGMPEWPSGDGMGFGMSSWGPSEWAAYSPPWNDPSNEFAVKLTKGATLPAAMTTVTENPLYIQGNYNTGSKKGAAVMADAVTVLSNRWGDVDNDGVFDSDLTYSQSTLSARKADATTVNAAIMTGNTDTVVGGAYNGGLENLPRLLEDWDGVTMSFRGSLIALWNSAYGVGAFGKSGVYLPPIRNWSFDADLLNLANLPPNAPRIYEIRVTSWKRN